MNLYYQSNHKDFINTLANLEPTFKHLLWNFENLGIKIRLSYPRLAPTTLPLLVMIFMAPYTILFPYVTPHGKLCPIVLYEVDPMDTEVVGKTQYALW